MLNKNNLFVLFSIFLGLIVSFFYNKEFNETFIVMFVLISIIFYIIFYFLADIRDKENFTNYYNSNLFTNEYYKADNNIREYLEDIVEEEHSTKYFNNHLKNIVEEENYSIKNNLNNDKLNITDEEQHIIKEKSHPYNVIEEELSIPSSLNNIQQNIPEEETSKYVKPDLNNILLTNPVPNGTSYTPLNINISYNAQNSNNELDNNKFVDNDDKEDLYRKNKNKNKSKSKSKNLGDYSYSDTTRIHNNSDWVYGENAWTNNPDYYIPRKVPQPLNQLMNTKKNKENTVCPLMINTPWTEYKSGDSEPEPYNL
jgi:Ca2+/Na+ antiporter